MSGERKAEKIVIVREMRDAYLVELHVRQNGEAGAVGVVVREGVVRKDSAIDAKPAHVRLGEKVQELFEVRVRQRKPASSGMSGPGREEGAR